jgi:outer membrane lipase/esterase
MLLALPVAVDAQGLNEVLIRILNNNCNELGGAGNTQGSLNNLCTIPGTASGSAAGGGPTVDSQLGQTQEQRRQADRLAERRGGQGGSADQPGTGFGLFVNGDYQFLNKDTTRFETGFEQHTAGTTLGLDYSFRGRTVLGVAVNYAHEFGDFAGVGGGFNNDAYGVTLYGTVVPLNNLFIDGFLGYTRREYSINRRVYFLIPGTDGPPPTDRVALGRIDGDTHSNEVSVGTTIGYDFVIKNFTVGPRVGLNYLDRRIAGYQESGNTGLELIYDNQNIASLTTTAGLFASVAISTRFGVLVPQANAEYVHEFLNDQRTVGFALVDTISRPRFLFQTDTPDRNFFNLGLGTVLVLPGGMSTFVNVRELVGYNTRRATTVTAGLRMAF